MNKRLYRSRVDSKIGGVCGGLGEYFDVDPTLIRIAAVALVFLHGAGLLAYIIAWIVMPRRPIELVETASSSGTTPQVPKARSSATLIVGVILIAIGGIFLLRNLYWWIDFEVIVAIAIIILGLFLLGRPLFWRDNMNNTPQSGGVLP